MFKKLIITLSILCFLGISSISSYLAYQKVVTSIKEEQKLQNEQTKKLIESSKRAREERESQLKNAEEKINNLSPIKGKTAEEILSNIESIYDFNRFIDTWGYQTQGLFIPSEAWNLLNDSQKSTMINYAQANGLKAVITGNLKGKNNMYLGNTVWGQ